MTANRFSAEQIDELFTYHAPTSVQVPKYEAIRDMAKHFAHQVNVLCPESREKSLAITHLQEVVMWANAAIAIHGGKK